MEQRIVLQEKTKYIYWIKDNENIFYLTIPATKKVSIILNILNEINDNIIKSIPEIEGKILVTPVIQKEILDGLKENNAEYFEKVSEILANELNLSHRILTYNHLEVDNNVYLNNNKEFVMFNTWFNKKYEGRVILLEPIEHQNSISVELKQESQTNVQQEPIPSVVNKETAPVTATAENINNGMSDQNTPSKKDLGFVSYVLLGVVAAIASLLFLYFIL